MDDGFGGTAYVDGKEVSAVPAWEFTPAQDYNGSVTFNYEVADGTAAASANTPASITIYSVDDDPTITVPVSAVSATEDQAQLIEGISISDVDVTDVNQELSVTLSVTDGELDIGHHHGSTVTLTGTKSYINGELAGVNRDYREDDEFSGKEPDEAGFTGGTLTQISGLDAVTQTREKDIYSIGGKKYIRVDFESATDAGTAYPVETYREVESTGQGQDKVWSFKSGGDVQSYDGTTSPGTVPHEWNGQFTMVVAITHDDNGQYWALESVTQTYKALEIEGLAVYAKDGVNYQHDTVLDTLQALTTEYASMGSTPMGFVQPTAGQAPTLLTATPVATGETLGGDTVDVYSYNYTYQTQSQDILLAYDTSGGGAVYKGAGFVDEVVDTDVTAQSIADDYDFATNGYTKVSGLHYTGDGNQANDTVSIVV